jgi:hypothetical protein
MGKDVNSPPGHTAFSNPFGTYGIHQKVKRICLEGRPIGF